MTDCSSLTADWAKLEAMSAIFKSPSSLAYHVGKDLVVNGKDIYHEVDTAIADYEAGNWADFGENVGMAAAKTILGKESQTKIKVGKVLQGIVASFGGNFNLEALLECVYEEDQAALILDAAYNEFVSAYKNKDVGDLIGGVIAVIAGIKQIEQGIPTCKAIDTTSWNFAGFDKSMDIMTHPTKHFKILEEELFINGVNIMKFAGECAEAYGKGDYSTFGVNMGNILKLATHVHEEPIVIRAAEPMTHQMSTKDMTVLTKAFLEATNVGTFNFTQLLMCIRGADQAALLLDESVVELKKAYTDKNMQEAVQGLMEAVGFVQTLKGAIPTCEAVVTKSHDWTTFNNIVNVLESPTQHMDVVAKDVIFNGKTITNDIKNVLETFRAGEWENFGKDFGLLLKNATQRDLFLY